MQLSLPTDCLRCCYQYLGQQNLCGDVLIPWDFSKRLKKLRLENHLDFVPLVIGGNQFYVSMIK